MIRDEPCFFWLKKILNGGAGLLNPFGAPKPLPILNPSHFVPKKGFQL